MANSLSSSEVWRTQAPSTFLWCYMSKVGVRNEASKNLLCDHQWIPILHYKKNVGETERKLEIHESISWKLIVYHNSWLPYPEGSKSQGSDGLRKPISSKIILFMCSIQQSGIEEKELIRKDDMFPLQFEKNGRLVAQHSWIA